MSTPDIDDRMQKIEALKNQHRMTLLNEFIPEQTGGTLIDKSKNAVERMVKDQLDTTLATKDKEGRLKNLTALRSSMEMMNSEFSASFLSFTD